MKNITKIVLTGGPCAGKSASVKWIQREFTEKGYKVLVVPETATELITGGVAPWTCGTPFEYQCCQMRLQLDKESVFMEAANTMPEDKILIIYDRGMLDNLAYMSHDDFLKGLEKFKKTEKEVCEFYDAVFMLNSAANGVPEIYERNKEGNAARIENVEQAVELDNKLTKAWKIHPNFRVIESSVGFDKKMHRLINDISTFLEEAKEA